MHAILAALSPGSTVLDLGSGPGSSDAPAFPLAVIRADVVAPQQGSENFVVCSASALPFASRSFNAVILNHSFEHFENLPKCVSEIARVPTQGAFLYIAVPDASTFADRLYRWLARGGGHVSLFSDANIIPQTITAATGLPHAGTRVLRSSLSFLNRTNTRSNRPRRLLLLGYGHETVLRTLTLALRYVNRWFHWRASVYGWAFYFGERLSPDQRTWSNVCVRCGSGHPSSSLRAAGSVIQRRFLPSFYACPQCKVRNFFTDDDDLQE